MAHKSRKAVVSPEELVQSNPSAGDNAWLDLTDDGLRAVAPDLLAAAGIEPGASVHVRYSGDCLEILSRSAALRRAQRIVRPHVPDGVSLVDELFAERRKEAEQGSTGPAQLDFIR